MSEHTEQQDEIKSSRHEDTKSAKSNNKTIIISIAIGAAIIAGAFFLSRQGSENSSSNASKSITMAELSQANGKNGQPCYVAVDGKVYEVKQGKKWKDGEHTTSNGQMECGVDGSELIKSSPHGKSILSVLTQVGSLSQ